MPDGPYQEARIRYAKVYVAVATVAFVVLVPIQLWAFGGVFYAAPRYSPADLLRFAWMVPWLFLGAAWRAWELRNDKDCPHMAYCFGYPVTVISFGLFAFAIVHGLFANELAGWLYYLVAPAVGLLIGVLAIPGFLMRFKL